MARAEGSLLVPERGRRIDRGWRLCVAEARGSSWVSGFAGWLILAPLRRDEV